VKTLADMHPGDKATIVSFTDEELSLKLLEMGCIPGEQIIFKKNAPLGCPMAIEVSGYSLSLRKAEAATVIVNVGN
jgi:ferrous iron transport protein A